MEKTVIIIDDEKVQADGLSKGLTALMPEFNFEPYSGEKDILYAIENRFYTLAIVDIRMDGYSFNGIDIVKKILEVNPFSKVIIISAFKDEFFQKIKELLVTGKVVDVLEKEALSTWLPKLEAIIKPYFKHIEENPSEINNALLQYYADAKNETDTYKKGERFEHFISLLFGSFGFKQIQKRVIDKSLNEIDLLIRNETSDSFLSKFGKYILVECKNKPETGVSKNDFIVFHSKVSHSNNLSELGIIATTGYISWNTYYEAIRDSNSKVKIMFISNPQIEELIKSTNKLETFKSLIDKQVKDNK